MEVTPNQHPDGPSWVDDALALSGKSKKKLAFEALGHGSAAYLNRLRDGRVAPTSKTIRRVAAAAGIPEHMVALFLVRGGHPEESLDYLAALEHVGRIFCAQAGVKLDPIVGVPDGWVAGHHWTRDNKRQPPRKVVVSAQAFQQETLTDTLNPQRIVDFVVLPKPTALAINLAILGFPRRGDVLSSGNASAFEDLLELYGKHGSQEWAKKIIGDAGERLRLPRLLRDARDILLARGVEVPARHAIACELIQAWADSLCLKFSLSRRYKAYVSNGVIGTTSPELPAFTQRLHQSLFPESPKEPLS